MKTSILHVLILGILVFSGCTTIDQNSTTGTNNNTATTTPYITSVDVTQNQALGQILTDSQGMTLYVFQNDKPWNSTCYGACASTWKPLLTQGEPIGNGIARADLDDVIRTDGGDQVTYKTMPLYRYSGDNNPGDTKGEGFNHLWFAVRIPSSSDIPQEITQYSKDWVLPNKDYSNTRETKDSTINSGNVKNLGVAWSVPITANGAFGGAASNPLILGKTVYFQDLAANVFALDLSTGSIKWQKIYNSSFIEGPNGPAVGYGKIYISKDLYSLTALDINNGNELWTTKLSPVNTTGVDLQPTVYDGLVYTSTVPGTGDIFYTAGGIGFLYALDQATGAVRWNFSTVDSPNLWGHPEVNSGGGSWYTPAVDTQTGTIYWGIGNPAPFPGTKSWPSGTSRPGPNLYTDSMIALDHSSGFMSWYTQAVQHDLFDHDLQIAPILATANVSGKQQGIVIGSGKMGRVYAFNRQVGGILWESVVGVHNENDQLDVLPLGNTRVMPAVIGGVETPMAYSDGIVYVPVIDMFSDWTSSELNFTTFNFSQGKGELVAVDANTGRIKWYKTFDSINVGGATVVNDLVFTATYDGMIYGFNKKTGEQLYTYKAPAGINAWPAVAGDTIIWPAGVGGNPSLIALRLGGQTSQPTTTTKQTTTTSRSTVTTTASTGNKNIEITLIATKFAFNMKTITVPAGAHIIIHFNNQDNHVPHNFALYTDQTAATMLFKGQNINGISSITYEFDAPKTPGTYFFRCDVHPMTMTGDFVVM